MTNEFEHLQGAHALRKLKAIITKAEVCFFCTNIKTGLPFSARPMLPRKIEDNGTLWFLSEASSKKNTEIAENNWVQLIFQSSNQSGFLTIHGKAEIIHNPELVQELWEPRFDNWLTNTENAQPITLIKVTPTNGHYWDTKYGSTITFLEQVAGAVMGTNIDDSVEGSLTI